MMKEAADSLAGRVAIFELSGLSSAEIDMRSEEVFHPNLPSLRKRMEQNRPKNIHQIYERIFRGSMPKLITTELDRDRFYQDYVNTYLERDVRDLA